MLTRISCGLVILALAPAGWAAGDQKYADLGTCKLESGQTVSDCRIGYRTFGTLNGQKSNAILFPTWFTGRTANLVDQVGPGKLVDSTRWFVVLLDALGDGVSSSPSNSKQQARQKFPEFTIADMVQTEYRVATETLHLSHVHAVMGISMGGMQTFQWVFSYPDFMDAAVPIVGSPQLTSTDLLLWTAELHALEESAKWQNGNYTDHPEMRAVTDIHELALTTPTYRAEHPGRAGFKEYLTKAEADTSFDWNDWFRQLQAMMSMDVARPWGGSIEEAAKHVKPKMLIVASEQDHMVNPLPGLKLAKLAGERTVVLHGNCGHLAPGCEEESLDKEVSAFLSEGK
jgi:homoserine O-acetyltransferase/O-succinyltransferase